MLIYSGNMLFSRTREMCSVIYMFLGFVEQSLDTRFFFPPSVREESQKSQHCIVLKLTAILILVRKKDDQSPAHIFKDTYFESPQMSELLIMHCFENINHDNPLNFFFGKSLQNLFACKQSASVISSVFKLLKKSSLKANHVSFKFS